jgi:hypothetical protein
MGTHFFTVSQNNVVAVSFQSIRISPYLSIPVRPKMTLPLREAPSRKYFPMLKVVEMDGTVEGILSSTNGKMEILLPQLELALCVAGGSHPLSTFQPN